MVNVATLSEPVALSNECSDSDLPAPWEAWKIPGETSGNYFRNWKVLCPGQTVARPESLREAGRMDEPRGGAAWQVMELWKVVTLVGSNLAWLP